MQISAAGRSFHNAELEGAGFIGPATLDMHVDLIVFCQPQKSIVSLPCPSSPTQAIFPASNTTILQACEDRNPHLHH
jgi:hypothetical protein